jgi:hypothetical protein
VTSRLVPFAALALAGAGYAAGCASTPRTTFDDDAGPDAAVVIPADGGEKPPVFTDAGLDDAKPPTGPAEVFGHSGTTLYRLDPDTRAAQTVGTFSGCNEPSEAVLDIALDEKSAMFGTTRTGLFKIDKATAKCTKIAAAVGNKEFPNSLSFVPKGTLDANSEALVGYVDDEYVRIDPQTGQISSIGKLDTGSSRLISSGDIVSVIGGPTYLTVKSAGNDTQCDAADCLVEVDPKTGKILRNFGQLNGKTAVFGVAFWAGAVYGFDRAGNLFQVIVNGGSLTLSTITIPQAPAGLSFFGAGSTTAAPVLPK